MYIAVDADTTDTVRKVARHRTEFSFYPQHHYLLNDGDLFEIAYLLHSTQALVVDILLELCLPLPPSASGSDGAVEA